MRVVMGLFALASAGAAAAWQHYGDTAKAAIADHVPPFVLAWSQPSEKPAAAEQPGAPAVEATTADQGTVADQAVAQPAQPAQAAAPVVSAAAPDTTPSLQTMSRDLASMGQQIEQLKASIAQLKAGQDQMSREMAKTSDARPAEARTSGAMTSGPSVRPKPPVPPVHATAAPVRKPKPAYSALPPPAAPAYPQAAAASPPPPATAAAGDAITSNSRGRWTIGAAPDAAAVKRDDACSSRWPMSGHRTASALMRSPHHLHGVLDVTPLFRFLCIALAFASQRILGGLCDGSRAVLLEHLPRDSVNLRMGYHVALLMLPARAQRSIPSARCAAFKPSNRNSRSLLPYG